MKKRKRNPLKTPADLSHWLIDHAACNTACEMLVGLTPKAAYETITRLDFLDWIVCELVIDRHLAEKACKAYFDSIGESGRDWADDFRKVIPWRMILNAAKKMERATQ